MFAAIVDFGKKTEMYSIWKETLSPDKNISTRNQIQRRQAPGKEKNTRSLLPWIRFRIRLRSMWTEL